MSVKGVLFDLDDTVVYSEESRFNATNKVLEKFGIKIKKEDWKKKFRSLGSVRIFEILKEIHSLDFDSQELYKKAHNIRLKIEKEEGVKLVEGVEKLFNFLDKNKIPFIICTGGTTNHATQVLKSHNLEKIPHFGREYYENRKPSPDAFLEGLKRLNMNAEDVIVFEDSYTGIQSGIVAGCQVIGVNNNPEEDVESLGLLAKIKTFEELDYSIFE